MDGNIRVQVLGCDGGIGDPNRTSSLLLDDDVLIDAGTGVNDLPLSALTGIDHVFLTHAHLDHITGLPLLIDAVMLQRSSPVTVHATDETLSALKAHVFNWSVWPDFTQIPSSGRPVLTYSTVGIGKTVRLGHRRITPVPATHTIPTVGFQIDSGRASLIYCGDTTTCDPLWETVNAIDNLEYLIIETAFNDAKHQLAKRAGHLCPSLLAIELDKLQRSAEIYIGHIKPGLHGIIMREIAEKVQTRRPRELKRGQILQLQPFSRPTLGG